jgi:formamidopyrimidine-DNA glycosylase
MPELPEVETTRRSLEPALVGKRIMHVDVRRARMVRRQAAPGDFAARLTGRTVRALRRHGKFLLADVSGDLIWVTHLGMSGRVSLSLEGDEAVPHTNVVVRVGGGVEMRLIDPRTFGFVVVYTHDELAASPLAQLGPDALEDLPSVSDLARRLDDRKAPIKALLLDQRLLAGVGNIYADEALYRAHIAPQRPGGSLDRNDVSRLRNGIRASLDAGLRWGGTSLDDLAYLLPDGRAGEFASRLKVYGRVDEPCARCGTLIRQQVIRQRTAHWCPTCQR